MVFLSMFLTFNWLHDVSVIQWLVCKWLRREGREQRVGLLSSYYSLAVVGCRVGIDAHM